MNDQELIDSKILDEKAIKWIQEVAPEIFNQLKKVGINYDDEMICHLLSDGFKIGYATCFKELRGQESEQ